MTQQRKTASVEAIKTEANRLLALPDNELLNDDFRMGIICFTEHILMATGNYKGWNSLPSQWLPESERDYGRTGNPIRMLRDDANDTRRYYY